VALGIGPEHAEVLELGQTMGDRAHVGHDVVRIDREQARVVAAQDRVAQLVERLARDGDPLLGGGTRLAQAVDRRGIALGTLDRPSAVGQRQIEQVGARVLATTASPLEVPQTGVHGLMERLLEPVLGAEHGIHGARRRPRLLRHGAHRERVEPLRGRDPLSGLQQPLTRSLVVLLWSAHGLTAYRNMVTVLFRNVVP
jgi:hypothetical protein